MSYFDPVAVEIGGALPSGHLAGTDPHGDRAYALALVDAYALALDANATFSNANATLATTVRYAGQTGTMSAARTVTIPDASDVGAGRELVIADESGTVTATKRIVVATAGSDTIDGYATAIAITVPYGSIRLRSNGTSQWVTVTSRPPDAISRLDPWWRALAAAKSSPVDVLVVGDSISEGQGSTSAARLPDRWIQRVLDALRAVAQPSGVRGGRGYVPAYYDINSTDYPPATVGFARSGTITLDTVRGLGRRAAQLGSGGTLTITETFSSFDVVFRKDVSGNAGVFSVSIDGGSATNIDTTSAPYTHGGYTQRFTPTTRGRHSITITRVSGAPIVEGVMFYDGDEACGVRMWDGAKSGYTASSFASNATVWESLYAAQPDLVVLALGTNDFRANRTPAQFSTSIASIIASVRSQTAPGGSAINATCPILLVHVEEPADSTYTYAWAQYRDVLRSIAATTDGVALVDVSTRLAKGQLMSGDNLHPTAAGHQFIASVVAGELLTGWRSSPAPARLFAAGAAVQGRTGYTQVVGSGSFTTTTFYTGGAIWQVEDFADAVTIASLAIDLTGYGGAGSVVRVVCCADDGSGFRPGTVMGQNTIDAAAGGTGIRSAAVPMSLPAGRYWFAAIVQVAGTPTLRSTVNGQRSPTPLPLLLNLTAQYPCTGSIPGAVTDNPALDGYASYIAPAIAYVYA